MSNTLIIGIAAFLILSIFIANFWELFKNLLTVRNGSRSTKIIRTVLIIAAIAALVVIGYFTFFSSHSFSIPSINSQASQAYYNNPDYWHDYIHYRNDQFTKIYNPYYWRVAIYGKWKKVEEVGYNVREVAEGYEVINKYLISEFSNDSILTVKIRQSNKTQEYRYYFDDQQRLNKIEGPNSEAHLYSYENGNEIKEYSMFKKDGLEVRHTITSLGGKNYKVSIYDKNGTLISEEIREHDIFGFPSSATILQLFQREHKELIGSQVEYKSVFEETEKISFEYQGPERKRITRFLVRGQEATQVEGKGYQTLLYEPNWKLGEGSIIQKRQLRFNAEDKNDNWIVCIYFENSRAKTINLRQVTYNDGTVVGSIAPETIKNINIGQ
ncbi:hypothetical protein [Flavilitoribacter nigricans]|uniref:Uncharacterized protein n=1 Tax=Flavilitoribacter nigricans (strain ATCC 23147 / DSM 23189 / NBRC 102662 / NCIMB 1420 / SS-2) TaxID=1122177 RepID=A0A2D0N792_FLAN2|nr:hypothetical protein [Flavilitoribacter nigricans]PHN04381.1 hypothetical protein CRP01_22750 [Flavilitoribacter nigricans DSM 23189 = NBRC 102662]